MQAYCEDLLRDLKKAGVKANYDDRTNYTAGWKFNHWEQKVSSLMMEEEGNPPHTPVCKRLAVWCLLFILLTSLVLVVMAIPGCPHPSGGGPS